MSWAQAKRVTSEFFHFVDGVIMHLSFVDYPPLMPPASTGSPSPPSPMLPVLMDETFSSSLKIVAEHLSDAGLPYPPVGYHPSSLQSPLLAALEVSVPNITLDVAPGDGPTVKSAIVKMLGSQSRIRQRDAELHELGALLRQQDVDVKDPQRQVQEMAAQLHVDTSTSLVHHQSLQISAMEHRDHMHEVYERAATQWKGQVVQFDMTGLEPVFQDLCEREKEDHGADPSSGVSPVS